MDKSNGREVQGKIVAIVYCIAWIQSIFRGGSGQIIPYCTHWTCHRAVPAPLDNTGRGCQLLPKSGRSKRSWIGIISPAGDQTIMGTWIRNVFQFFGTENAVFKVKVKKSCPGAIWELGASFSYLAPDFDMCVPGNWPNDAGTHPK